MALEHRLSRWARAGIITAEQVELIREFERSEQRPTLLYAVAGLGGLAIAVGLLSIVAANWDGIPGRVKIALDLALVAALGAGVWHWDRGGPVWARETAIVILWGLVLASIALLGQVYQLGGQTHHALLAWCVLTALLMTRARSRIAASVWVLGLQVTYAVWCAWLAEAWDAEELALGLVYWAPLTCLGLGRLPALVRVRPALAGVLESLGWMELLLCGTLGTFAFYADASGEQWSAASPAILVSVVLTLALAATMRASLPERLLLVACLVLSHVPLFVSTGDMDLTAAVTFVGLWLLVAWTAHDARDIRMLNAATAVLGLRILSIYFEVFGSLLDTGVGLISGGVVTLTLVWLWTRGRKRFERELARPQNEEDA